MVLDEWLHLGVARLDERDRVCLNVAAFVPEHGFNEKLDVYANVSAQLGDYEKQNVLFQTFRKDRQYDAAIGMIYHFDRKWTLRPQLAYTRNQSNIQTSDYERYDISFTLRRDFR